MKESDFSARFGGALMIATASVILASCATTPLPCVSPQTRNLNHAVEDVKSNLRGGACAAHFDRYYDDLLTIAEGDPKAENKRIFSEFLVWASDAGLLSQRQARDYYNRSIWNANSPTKSVASCKSASTTMGITVQMSCTRKLSWSWRPPARPAMPYGDKECTCAQGMGRVSLRGSPPACSAR